MNLVKLGPNVAYIKNDSMAILFYRGVAIAKLFKSIAGFNRLTLHTDDKTSATELMHIKTWLRLPDIENFGPEPIHSFSNLKDVL